ncbi:hypothetical protein Scep_027932 [Stephania cephalantha]|uniref:Uncharacterized protein n=1 Tax=Stephania cephalantha TaxID=152367 RepID=A0AAP0EB66_9MAGN
MYIVFLTSLSSLFRSPPSHSRLPLCALSTLLLTVLCLAALFGLVSLPLGSFLLVSSLVVSASCEAVTRKNGSNNSGGVNCLDSR